MTGCILRVSFPLCALLSLGWASPAQAAPGDFVEDDAVALWHVQGQLGSGFGWAVSELADIDGDGAMDAITGAPYHNERGEMTGLLVVLSGRTGQEIWRWTGEPGSLLGYAMADAGDVNGDGVHDVVGGAPGVGAGWARIYSGADGTVLHTIDGESAGDAFGSAVAGAGDLDGDGLADVLVGAEMADLDPKADDAAGRAYVVSGASGVFIHTLLGPQAGANLGSAAAWVGDLDGDGVDDPFVGARSGGTGGQAIVFRGSDGTTLHTVEGGPDGGAIAWFFAGTPGDVNGDGVHDLYVGDFSSGVAGPVSGRFQVFSGQDGTELYAVPGTGPGQGLGCGRGSGDVDNDGVPDLVVGSYSSSDGVDNGGRISWYSGVDGTVLRDVTSLEMSEQLGFDVVGIGDVDRDGLLDVLASGAAGDNVYVIAGVPLGDEGGTGTGTGGDTTGDGTGDGTTGGTTTGEDTGAGDLMGDSGGTTGDSGPSLTTSASADTGGSEGSDSTSAGAGDDGGDAGCGCRATGTSAGLPWLVMLLGLPLARRRRRSSTARSR